MTAEAQRPAGKRSCSNPECAWLALEVMALRWDNEALKAVAERHKECRDVIVIPTDTEMRLADLTEYSRRRDEQMEEMRTENEIMHKLLGLWPEGDRCRKALFDNPFNKTTICNCPNCQSKKSHGSTRKGLASRGGARHA